MISKKIKKKGGGEGKIEKRKENRGDLSSTVGFKGKRRWEKIHLERLDDEDFLHLTEIGIRRGIIPMYLSGRRGGIEIGKNRRGKRKRKKKMGRKKEGKRREEGSVGFARVGGEV